MSKILLSCCYIYDNSVKAYVRYDNIFNNCLYSKVVHFMCMRKKSYSYIQRQYIKNNSTNVHKLK